MLSLSLSPLCGGRSFREELGKAGVIFCSISEAVRDHPDLVRKHLGSVVGLLSLPLPLVFRFCSRCH